MKDHSTGVRSNKPRHSAKSSRSGQTIVEYALTVTIMTMIFGLLFYNIRISLFRYWICEIAPRIEAPHGCKQIADCWKEIVSAPGYGDSDSAAANKCREINK